jgi:hypothetical protein
MGWACSEFWAIYQSRLTVAYPRPLVTAVPSERVPEERLLPAGSTSSLLKQLALVATSSSSDWFWQLAPLAMPPLAIGPSNRDPRGGSSWRGVPPMRSRCGALIYRQKRVCSRRFDDRRRGASSLGSRTARVDSFPRVNSQADGGISESQQLARSAQIGTLQRWTSQAWKNEPHTAVLQSRVLQSRVLQSRVLLEQSVAEHSVGAHSVGAHSVAKQCAGEPAFAAERSSSHALRQSATGAGERHV